MVDSVARGDAPGTFDSMPGGQPRAADLRRLERLRAGDDAAFSELIDEYQASLMRLARTYVHDAATAAEVVQDTWIGLFESLDRFEGRASLKTWLFRILINCARSRVRKDAKGIPFSALFNPAAEGDEPAVDGDRFQPASGAHPGHWASRPARWDELPEGHALAAETRLYIAQAVEALPPAQREVITLRDVEGLTAEEVCNLLGVSGTNQRVLLHRARSKVRRALEAYFER
jgi:RNA polymerase sigma-70 factor (ECF subfamily)